MSSIKKKTTKNPMTPSASKTKSAEKLKRAQLTATTESDNGDYEDEPETID